MPSARSLLALAACALAAPVATASAAPEGSRYQAAVRSPDAAVSTVSAEASAAAAEVLEEGGTAMDAAVTAALALGSARPELCGIGGGGALVHRSAAGFSDSLDFLEQAPVQYAFSAGASLGPQRYAGTGAGVAGVPGLLAGMQAALARHGTISLAEALEPAEALARDGVEVTDEQAEFFAEHAERLRLYPETREALLADGLMPYAAGDTLRQPALAETLALVAEQGPDAFYAGPVAEAVAAAMSGSILLEGDEGTMGLDDLAGYRPFWRRTLQTSYRNARVLTAPPPVSGGLALVQALNLLERVRPFPGDAAGAERLHLLAEAHKLAWADRAAHVGDPRFTQAPLKELAGMDYAARRRPSVTTGRARTYRAGAGAAEPERPEAGADDLGHGTHVSVIDARGNAAAISCSVGQPFGSAVVAGDTGVLLNASLAGFNAPGTGTAANAPAPRKRPRSSLSPTVALLDGEPRLVAGGGGGAAVPAGVLATVVGTFDDGLDPGRAVDALRAEPRGTCAGTGLQLCVEDARLAPGVLGALRDRGHVTTGLGEYAIAPEIVAAGTQGRALERLAAVDPRGEGGAVVPDAVPAGLDVRASPSRPRAGRRTRVRFTVRDEAGKRVRRARIAFAGASLRTGKRGTASVKRRFRAGVVSGIVSKRGFARAVVIVQPRK